MIVPMFAAFGQFVFMILLGSVATFLILLVLVQRGRGGGLAGALGGMGGSSAFGAKAGDVFTKITVIAATCWILLCIAATKMTPADDGPLNTGIAGAPSAAVEGPALESAAGSEEASVDEGEAVETAPAETSADAAAENGDTVGEPAAEAESSESETTE